MAENYICDYCGSKMYHVCGDLWKCSKKYCAAEAYMMENGVLDFDDDYNKNGFDYDKVFLNDLDNEDDEDEDDDMDTPNISDIRMDLAPKVTESYEDHKMKELKYMAGPLLGVAAVYAISKIFKNKKK